MLKNVRGPIIENVLTYARVRAVVPAMSAKPPGIFPRAYVSTFSVIGPRTFKMTEVSVETCF